MNQGQLFSGLGTVDGYSCSFRCQFATASTAAITQSSRFNSASVNQYGTNEATITQEGTGTDPRPNVALITQMGGGEASILQGVDVAPSANGDPSSGSPGDPRYFAGGARHAEAHIRQQGAAIGRIEQRGRGQYALIDQAGMNSASILQEVGATNATAIITQSGSGNSYNVVQTQPGQYINVSQTGTNNSVTNVISRP